MMDTKFELGEETKVQLEEKLSVKLLREVGKIPGLSFMSILDWVDVAKENELEFENCTSDIAESTYELLSITEMYEIAAENQDVRCRLDTIHKNYQSITVALEVTIKNVKQDALQDIADKYSRKEIMVAAGKYDWSYPSTDEEINLVKKYIDWREMELKAI